MLIDIAAFADHFSATLDTIMFVGPPKREDFDAFVSIAWLHESALRPTRR
jgi:hypothetical protein